MIVHDPARVEDHAIAAAKLDGRWLTLDNRRMAMVWDADATDYRPVFVLDRDGVMRYVDAPLLADASGRIAAPVTVSALATFATPGLSNSADWK